MLVALRKSPILSALLRSSSLMTTGADPQGLLGGHAGRTSTAVVYERLPWRGTGSLSRAATSSVSGVTVDSLRYCGS